jgi:hypothetical protein
MRKRRSSDKYLERIRSERYFKDNSKSGVSWQHRTKTPHFQPLIDMQAHSKGKHTQQKILGLKVPAIFSLTENPEESLEFIAQIAAESNNGILRKLYLDHSEVKSHDLGAELLLGFAAKELKSTAMFRNVSVELFGDLPKSDRKKRLIRSMGIVKKLDIESQMICSSADNIEIFDFRGTKQNNVSPGSEDRKNKCGRTFVDHINSCLHYDNRQLTDYAVQRLLDFLGETIGNAEDHSCQPYWNVCGYLDNSSDGEYGVDKEMHFCEIVIYNFGKSIADTFHDLDDDSFAKVQVLPYIEAHKDRGWFSPDWSEDDLLTLAALQSHISSKNIDITTDRGQGTVDLIEFFQQVARECAKDVSKHARMSIISGETHILFDEKYSLQPNAHGREIIAFNSANDLKQQPDSDYITHFKRTRFPGTIINIRFPLSSDYTKATKSN